MVCRRELISYIFPLLSKFLIVSEDCIASFRRPLKLNNSATRSFYLSIYSHPCYPNNRNHLCKSSDWSEPSRFCDRRGIITFLIAYPLLMIADSVMYSGPGMSKCCVADLLSADEPGGSVSLVWAPV